MNSVFGAEYLESIVRPAYGCGCADKLPAIKDATTDEVYTEPKAVPA